MGIGEYRGYKFLDLVEITRPSCSINSSWDYLVVMASSSCDFLVVTATSSCDYIVVTTSYSCDSLVVAMK